MAKVFHFLHAPCHISVFCSICNFAFSRFLFPSAIITFTCSLSSVSFTFLRSSLFPLHFHYFSHVMFFYVILVFIVVSKILFPFIVLSCFVYVLLRLNLRLNYLELLDCNFGLCGCGCGSKELCYALRFSCSLRFNK